MILTKSNVEGLIGQRIIFYSKQYEGNENILGTARIIGIAPGERHPIRVADTEGEGELLKYAFLEGEAFCLGDAYREIEILPIEGSRIDEAKLNSIREQVDEQERELLSLRNRINAI